MSDFKDRMADYVPVNERIEAFYQAFPEGSLQSEIVELAANRVTVRAAAYRKPDDPRPGIGHSSLEIPGSTTFTRGSEIENAETSAWGRAIAALGFEVKRGIASSEEVRNKQSQAPASREARPAAKPASGGVPTAAPADTEEGLPEFPPFDPTDGDAVVDAVVTATGGTEVTDLSDRISRAEAKAAEQRVCPDHGAARVKKNRKGYYCATNMGSRDEPQWCEWQEAA